MPALRLISSALVMLAVCLHAYAQPAVSMAATDPAGDGRTLPAYEPLFIRIAYASDSPLRFQASGWRDGLEIRDGASYNPAPPYPAGRGEAVAWVAYDRPTDLDEIRVQVFDADWQALQQIDRRIDVAWSTGGPRDRQRAAWATELSDAQQAMTRTVLNEGNGGSGTDAPFVVLFFLAAWSVPAYWALQIYAVIRVRDSRRKWVLAPLLITLPLLAYTLFALAAGSNLWPLMMIFIGPFAFVYLAAVMVLRRRSAATISDGFDRAPRGSTASR